MKKIQNFKESETIVHLFTPLLLSSINVPVDESFLISHPHWSQLPIKCCH
jgi:hypothetical protein